MINRLVNYFSMKVEEIVVGVPSPITNQENLQTKISVGMPASNLNFNFSNSNNQNTYSEEFIEESYHTKICCLRCGLTIFTISILTCTLLLLLNLLNTDNEQKNSVLYFGIFILLVLSIMACIVICVNHDKLQSIGLREYIRNYTRYERNFNV